METTSSPAVTPEQRLATLGLTLPPAPGAVGAYEPWVRAGSLIYTSGQLPWIDGDLKFAGKLGRELDAAQGYCPSACPPSTRSPC